MSAALDWREIVDTLHMISVLDPKKFSLQPSKKRGPKKSPDYIATDGSGNYHVLECKGTQTSRKALLDQVAGGKRQKKNLKARRRTVIAHSLVAGLFIPQGQSKERGCVRIADPEWQEIDRVLEDFPAPQVHEAIAQISVAKLLALSGFVEPARVLARSPVSDARHLSSVARSEILRRRDRSGHLELMFDTADLGARVESVFPDAGRARFWAEAPDYILGRLTEPGSLDDTIRSFGEMARNQGWERSASDRHAELQSPTGFRFRLEVD